MPLAVFTLDEAGKCRATGAIGIIRDTGWTPAEIDRLEAHINAGKPKPINPE